MRLRPTQFVFLLLLLCSVQRGEDYTRQITTASPASYAFTTQRDKRTHPASPQPLSALPARSSSGPQAVQVLPLRHDAFAVIKPAAHAAAIAHYTSLLRA